LFCAAADKFVLRTNHPIGARPPRSHCPVGPYLSSSYELIVVWNRSCRTLAGSRWVDFESWWCLSDKEPDMEAIETARAILRYLNGHPDAKDTLDGIASWWLLREWTERKIAEVKQAVSLLVEKGLILETPRDPQSPYYKLNNNKEPEIAAFLER
jgi:hypothetical protein